MIKARHQWWADQIFRFYIFRLLKKHFAAMKWFGEIPELDPELPSLLIPNHNTWWDGFFIYFLHKTVLKPTVYLMMLDDQLHKYSFFSRVGAYGIDPANPKAALRSLKYTVDILNQKVIPRNMVCMFPQGELQPWNPPGLSFKPGLEWIIKHVSGPVQCIPLAMRCEFIEEQRPEVFFLSEQHYIIEQQTFKGLDWLQEIGREQLQSLQDRIVRREQAQILLCGRQSVSERFDTLRGRSSNPEKGSGV